MGVVVFSGAPLCSSTTPIQQKVSYDPTDPYPGAEAMSDPRFDIADDPFQPDGPPSAATEPPSDLCPYCGRPEDGEHGDHRVRSAGSVALPTPHICPACRLFHYDARLSSSKGQDR